MQMKATPYSSTIVSHGYDPETQTMRVQFKSGGTYEYDGVSKEDYEAFGNASSPGGHLHAHIKPKYGARKL